MTPEPILTDAALKRIANADVSGEHSLMARELLKRRTQAVVADELIGCYETIHQSQNTWAIAAAREELPKLRERFREVTT